MTVLTHQIQIQRCEFSSFIKYKRILSEWRCEFDWSKSCLRCWTLGASKGFEMLLYISLLMDSQTSLISHLSSLVPEEPLLVEIFTPMIIWTFVFILYLKCKKMNSSDNRIIKLWNHTHIFMGLLQTRVGLIFLFV